MFPNYSPPDRPTVDIDKHTRPNQLLNGDGPDPQHVAYVIIEYCCTPTSRLCDVVYNKHPDGRHVVRIRLSEEHDMTSKKGLEIALSIVDQYKENCMKWTNLYMGPSINDVTIF